MSLQTGAQIDKDNLMRGGWTHFKLDQLVNYSRGLAWTLLAYCELMLPFVFLYCIIQQMHYNVSQSFTTNLIHSCD